ncbi:MAG: DUF6886 family protein [Fimbriimonadaceae bacterium]
MPLYHFSEEGRIGRFKPRAPIAHPETRPYVWAIDEWHAPLYFLPRDCPRVCFWPLPHTIQEDLEGFWGQAAGRIVICIEAAWYDRVRVCRLYRYSFSETDFESVEDHGVHVSRHTVEPVSVEILEDLPVRILDAGVELRLCPSLIGVARAVMRTSLHFSLIRMQNASGWDLPPGNPALPK